MLCVIQITEKDFNKIKRELRRAYGGLIEYSETLEDTCECSQHLDNINNILNKYKAENKGE